MQNLNVILFLVVVQSLVAATEDQRHMPVFLWSGQALGEESGLDDIQNLNSDHFETLLHQKVSKHKPLVVVFLEQHLTDGDFKWQDVSGHSCYPYLSNVTDHVEYFPLVEKPEQAIGGLSKVGYSSRWIRADTPLIDIENGTGLVLIEFRKIKGDRPTGSTWGSETQASARTFPLPSPQYLFCYPDQGERVVLLSQGPMSLSFVSDSGHRSYFPLIKYNAASSFLDSMGLEFILWFENYTITLYGTEVSYKKWRVDLAVVENQSGEKMALRREQVESEECAAEWTYLVNPKHGVNLLLPKYLMTQYGKHQAICQSSFSPVIFCFVLSSFLLLSLFLCQAYINMESSRCYVLD